MFAPVDANRAESTFGGGPVRCRTFSHDACVGTTVGAGTGTAVGFPTFTLGAGVGVGVGLGVVGCAVGDSVGDSDGASVGGRDASTPTVFSAIISCDAS